MTAQALLEELRARDIWVWADGDRLQCSTPPDVAQSEVADLLRQRKNEILDYLRGPAELSFAQQRLWLLDQIAPGGAAYGMIGALELRGVLNVPVLERALAALVNRHEALRTVFVNVHGEPMQVVSEPGPWSLPVVDLSAEADARERVKGLLREEASRGFDLARGPLFRVRLYGLAADTHVLLLAMHHIIYDGWSLGVLTRELGELYGAYARGEAPALPPLRVQYRDFARWQRGWLKGGVLEHELAHWRERLAGAPQVLELPTDRPRPAVESHRGAVYSFSLPLGLVDRLRDLSRREGATLFMTLLSGFALLLSRYSSQQDLLIGTPVANRNRAEIEPLIGFFVNTLMLRADTSGEPSVREFVAHMREVCLDAYAHQDLPFERLVEELQPVRDLSRNAVFQVMFALQNAPKQALQLPGVTLSPFSTEHDAVQFDLSLLTWETPEGLATYFSYATDLFDASTIARMATHWRVLLEAMVERPERRISELPLLTESERRQAISGWNRAVSYARGACLHERFERQVERTPDAVALVFEGEELSYAELNRRANGLAHRLRELGVLPDQLVGLRTERGVEMVVGILGILKAGGAYLPLDPAYPKDRIAFMLEDSHVAVVVTQKALADDLEGIAVTPVVLDELQSGAGTNPAPVATADNLAYVIYTSGSTGKPKGALISHYNVTRLFEATEAWYGFDQNDVWTLFHSYAFDFSVWELWGALLYGGRVVVVPYMTSRSPDDFRELLIRERVTVLNQTPSAFRQLIQADLARPKAELALRYVIFGGEALELQSLRPWFERYGDERPLLVNMYGITETTVHVTYRPIRQADLEAGQGSVIGMPIPDLQLYILYPHGEPVPIGVPGEMYVGGAGVARGYLNRAELTAQRFVADPFSTRAGSRLYRTGDLARRLANGDIEYLGRIDEQVKIRGFRIELGEIEAALSGHPAVRESAVLAREDTPGDKRLVAYVVANDGAPDDAAEQLRVHLRTTLPEYMVPAAFVTLDKLPLTPNGKVDRKALPAPEYSAATYVAPRTPTEETLAGIWAEVLKVERVGVHDNFFELGGHSLLATQVVSRVRDALGVELPLRQVFAAPTVGAVAASVEALRNAAQPALTAPALEAAGEAGPIALSFAQQRLWFLDQLTPGSAAYVIAGAFELQGMLEVAALERAVGSLVERHESLRTVFVSEEGEPRQVVNESGPWTLPVTELSGEAEARERVKEMLREEVSRGFDLVRGPLFRAQLYRLGADTHVLLLAMHHIISDGWSLGVMTRELGELYRGFLRGEPASLPVLRVQYRDFARWQRGWLQGEVLQKELGHWRERLEGAPQVLELPTDRVRPALESHRGAFYAFTLPRELVDRLQALSRREGATLFMTLLAGFALLLSRYSGQQDLLIGTPVANRNRAEIEGLIGFFVNTLVLRADASGAPTVREFVAHMREVCLDAYAHQDLPFERLVEELHPARDMSRNPVYQVRFALQNAGPASLQIGEVPLQPLGVDTGAVHVDILLNMQETPDGAAGVFNYATDLFDESSIARMAGHLRMLLDAMVAAPECKVGELPLLTEPERHRLLVEWNDTAAQYPRETLVHELFEAQAARTPDAIAVVFEGERMSYAELNGRANELANQLRELGVGPDQLVGLRTERGVETVVGILGVLKAGGAYLPLDPGLPRERLAFMLEDACVAIVLTQKDLAADLDGLRVTRVLLDEPRAGAETDPAPVARTDSLAYVIYTSGSTGRPKGVAVEHRQISNYVQGIRQRMEFPPGASFALVSTVAADLGNTVLFPSLCFGGCLHVISSDRASDPAAFAEYCERHRIDCLKIVPSHFAALSGGPHAQKVMPRRLLILGGEASRRDWVSGLRESGSECAILNHYGPTETTVGVLTYRVGKELPCTLSGTVPVGRPLANSRMYVLDASMQPVPIGVAGELYIGGDGVARGYVGRPELTAERFLADPFSAKPGARVYRTGDRVRYLPDGNIEFLGRIDGQVKIRGFRIELGEIEAALSEHPNVREAAVLAREDSPGNERLVAYVVGNGDAPAELAEGLRTHLRTMLPEYMVPAAFVSLEKLPLTPNGKVDRRALPAPDAAAYTSRGYEAPEGEVEAKLAQIWAEVLKVERVGRHDNFFELGGHSLLAISLIERMRRAGLHAEVRALFLTPTLSELAQAVQAASGIVTVPPNGIPARCEAITPEMLPLVRLTTEEIERVVATVPGGAANVQDIYPLAPLQEGILFHHLMAREGDPYLQRILMTFDSRTGLDAYLGALQSVIDRHDILRTGVAWDGLNEPVQVVWRRARLKVEEVALDPAAGDIAAQLPARFDPRHYRIDVSQAPLMRVFIAEDAANARWLMALLFQHLVSDHVTLEVMQHEIQAHLLGQADELPAALPFRNFVAQARLGVSREEHEAYFKKLLGDVEEPTAPFGLVDVQGEGAGIVEARRLVDKELAKRLRERARALGVSAASLCHLAYAQVLARVSGRDDVVFGTVLFGRMQGGEGADRVLGLFINTLPVRIRVGEEGVQESVKRTHAQLAHLLRHEHASLALAQRASAVAAPAPLFSSFLNYRHGPAEQRLPVAAPAFAGMKFLAAEARSNYPLQISIDDRSEGLWLTAKVQSPIDPARICGYLHAALEQLVGALETSPSASLRSLEVLPEAERRQLVVQWNDTGRDYGREARIHRLIEQQVGATPEAIALEFEGQSLTYAEMNGRANQLARVLRQKGVGPDVLVGIFAERSLEMVLALLAILKAGGAYVPLDPSYPAERLAHMLEDARVSLVLAQKQLASRLPAQAREVHQLDASWTAYAGEGRDDLQDIGTPRDLAYVIFTSGSTGRPKGAMNEHHGVCNRLLWLQEEFKLTPDDRVMQKTAISFDPSVREFFWPLLAGARLVIARPEGHLDSAYLVDLIRRQGITHLQFVPSMLRVFLEQEGLEACGSLKRVLCSGEALTGELQERFFARLPGVELNNLYGPTECSMTVGHWACRQGDARRTVPIGRAGANVQLYALDAALKPVPVGVIGELHIGGIQVGRGYAGRPDLTAERFIRDPFSEDAGARLYKTGDLVRYLPDGAIEYLGRIDHQVKFRGFRVELGEIEATLDTHPAVAQSAVVVREDSPGDQRLVAYVVARSAEASAAQLKEHLSRQLPQYMVPGDFVFLKALPLTASGKVNRRGLPAPERSGPDAASYVVPRTPTEDILARIWAEVLGLERVGVTDNFFELGGHSLLAMRMVSRVREALDVELPLRELFAIPTVQALSAVLETLIRVRDSGNNIGAQQGSEEFIV